LEGTPQELIRRWGKVPICKDSRTYHELGIQTHTTFIRKERKKLILGAKTDLQEEELRK
jgi:hypothetical protein